MNIVRGTTDEIASLKIGDILYNFDGNRRVYRRNEAGIASGGPIYQDHFEAVPIIGETKVSWILKRYDAKVNKKNLSSVCQFADRGFFTESAMIADIWLHEHRYKIAKEVERAGVDHLKEVARIIGYVAVTNGVGK